MQRRIAKFHWTIIIANTIPVVTDRKGAILLSFSVSDSKLCCALFTIFKNTRVQFVDGFDL